jgi:hypothetical protein
MKREKKEHFNKISNEPLTGLAVPKLSHPNEEAERFYQFLEKRNCGSMMNDLLSDLKKVQSFEEAVAKFESSLG